VGKIKLCDYGCGQEAKYPFKNGKWCCSRSYNSCPTVRKRRENSWKNPNSGYNSTSYKEKMSSSMKKARKTVGNIFNTSPYKEKVSNGLKEAHKDPNSGFNTISYKKKISSSLKEAHKDPNSGYNSDLRQEKIRNTIKDMWKDPDSKYSSYKLTIENVNKKYPFFSKIEEMRYNPDKPDEKEVQVHCKNHECENSKEKDGWFTPTPNQLYERISILENEGLDNAYFYCCQDCKDMCPLYRLHGDPYKTKDTSPLPYTYQEIQILNQFVLEREKGLCEYCGEPATIVHHIRPKKLEPFFTLDPDYAIAVCLKCHYKYGHQGECSTGNLAKIVCSIESQKFLNQDKED